MRQGEIFSRQFFLKSIFHYHHHLYHYLHDHHQILTSSISLSISSSSNIISIIITINVIVTVIIIITYLTLSEVIIWNLCVMSAGLAGRRVRPEINLRNWMRSSLVKDSSTAQNHRTKTWFSSMPRYLN